MSSFAAMDGRTSELARERDEWKKKYEDVHFMGMRIARQMSDLRNALVARLGLVGTVPDDQLADAIEAKVADAFDAARQARLDLMRHERIHRHPAVVEAVYNVRQMMACEPERDDETGDERQALDAFLVHHEAE